MNTLYIIMRTDLASMNSGKGMAQASHAANAFTYENYNPADTGPSSSEHDIETWMSETKQGFGTVIVLGGSIGDIETAVIELKSRGYMSNIVHDPGYPVRDGDVTHLIPLDTCAYAFVPNREDDYVATSILRKFKLHP